jgi:large subunit ribosomal protein L22
MTTEEKTEIRVKKSKKSDPKEKVNFTSASKAVVMIKGSVEKLQRPLDVIRGASLKDAMNFLYFSNYGSSQPLAKLIKSAAANAVSNHGIPEVSSLWVSKIWAVKSLELRRMKAGPRGRGRPIKKRYCRVFVELGVKS